VFSEARKGLRLADSVQLVCTACVIASASGGDVGAVDVVS
jgi:hypothetical protein